MATYDAIVPAGGRITGEFAEKTGTDVKALIRFQEQTILERTILAMRDTGRISRIVVAGGDEVRSHASSLADEVIPEGTSGPDNIMRSLRHLLASQNPPDQIFIATSDLPFLDASQINGFLDRCEDGMDICVPIIPKAEYLSTFPGSSSTFIRLADGEWTIGGIYRIQTAAFERALPQIEKAFDNRKSKLGMARMLGANFLFRFFTNRLTVPDIEQKVRGMVGCSGSAIRGASPKLAFDIDAKEDYEYALRLMG